MSVTFPDVQVGQPLRYRMKASVTQSLKEQRGHRSDQGKVWEEVASLQAMCCLQSPTTAMSDTFDAYQDQVAELRKQLGYVEGATGMAVALGEKVVGCDLFDKPATCQKVWGRLLSGLMFDALEAKDVESQVNPVDVEKFVATSNSAAWEPAEPIREGTEYRAEFVDG